MNHIAILKARGHTCLFQYYSGVLLAAVRCGKYKLRFDLDPIELYDLDADIGERTPLSNTTAGWGDIVANIKSARETHLRTVRCSFFVLRHLHSIQ
jgi:hypothetical protein